jgi:hypothetical protein
MSELIGPDGRRWRVARQWLAWRPRPSRALRACWNAFLSFQDPFTAVIGVLALALLIPLALLHLLNWTAALLLTPFALLGRTSLQRPWPVLARADNGDEYRADADGARAADDLVDRVRTEISQYGEPKSLAPPQPPHNQTLGTPPPPAIDTAPIWLRRPVQWILRQTSNQPPRAGSR